MNIKKLYLQTFFNSKLSDGNFELINNTLSEYELETVGITETHIEEFNSILFKLEKRYKVILNKKVFVSTSKDNMFAYIEDYRTIRNITIIKIRIKNDRERMVQ